ncbi:MAG TPA: MFS transporter [Anaerolineales bacterium]
MQPEKIIRSYYVIAGLYTLSASLIWGVNTLFLLDAGLNILEVFIANAFFSVGMAVFEIPTGVLADTRGRRLSFLLSLSVLSLGTLGYVSISLLGGGLALFSLMSVILGLGYTFYSGAVEAWLVDALNAVGYQGSLDQVFARTEFISGAAMLVGTVGGGLLGQIDLAIPFVGRSLLLILLFGFAFVTMHDIGYQPRTLSLERIPQEMKAVAQASLKFGLGNASLRLIFLMSLIQSGFLYWGFYAWQPYFLDLLGQDAVWVAGVIAAFISLATMTGNGLVEWITRFCGKRTTLILWATAIGGLATIGVGLTGSFWVAVILLLVYMATTGVSTPVIHAYMHQVIPSGQRAAILSLNSMVGSGGGILAQTGLGYVSRVSSIASGYILGGAVSLLVLPLAGMLRRLQEPADVIVGRAGLDSACAAQGIPDISGLETATHPAASTK